ncbi:unspecific monooxygenase [Alternaria panax]|uniref:Unspecific monooxygenase n=1 Tax=Alternaria panax TaxID=48097 RepID=A0AAD4ID85_9PLEO|nr:unspecific monooxygenase [Alternaria panax]
MHSTILLAAWAGVSFVLYRIISSIIISRRHAAAARQLGCQPAYPRKQSPLDPLGIQNTARILAAKNEARLPQYMKEMVDDASATAGRAVTTLHQNMLGVESFFTVEPRNVQAILATQFKEFGLGERRNGNFFPLLGRGIFSSDGEKWAHARALLRPQFARDQVSDLDLEEEHVQNMMRAIPTNSDGWTDVTDLKPLFFRLTIDSATEFLFGESVDSQLAALPDYKSSKPRMAVSEQDFTISFDEAQGTIATANRLQDAYWLVFNKTFKEHCRRCHAFIDHFVQIALSNERSTTKEKSPDKQKYVFLDALAESTRDPIELRDQCLSILLAGRDTTSSLLSYVFMVLSQHEDVYKNLRNIVLESFGTYSNPQEITFEGLKSCNYLQWIMNETLRLYPVVPFDARRTFKDTTLPVGGGPDGTERVFVKKGTQVDYSVYVMHRRKDLWGADADEFKPERWDGRKVGWEYLPFNGGPRICLGQQFALTEAGYAIVRLVQRFEAIEGVGNSWEPKEKGGMGYVRNGLRLTTAPADGVKLRMKEARE